MPHEPRKISKYLKASRRKEIIKNKNRNEKPMERISETDGS
jgi:hypothetical protein